MLSSNTFLIYVVDDEQTIREGISLALNTEFRILTFETAEDVLAKLASPGIAPDLLLLDLGLPGMSGIDALRIIKGKYPGLQVVIITAYEDVETAVRVMKLGAYDYVVKPLHMASLVVTINHALETLHMRREIQRVQELCLQESHPYFVGKSDAILQVMDFVDQVAASPDTPVLISGETGTGKELVASAIHYRSPNSQGPLIKINCAAIPTELIESELFGYVTGAFSGARVGGKIGLLAEANNGSLFLDEIGDLGLSAQAKLLRFLEEGEFYRVGSSQPIKVTTRLVAATNKNLEEMMQEGVFRKDLYFRLAVVKVKIPSLKERCADILPLSRYFLELFSAKFGKSYRVISPDAEKLLVQHNWMGNIRELKNSIERGVLLGKGPALLADDLQLERLESGREKGVSGLELPDISSQGIDLDEVVRNVERNYIEKALLLGDGNESKAARFLHMNHHTFRYRRKKLFS